MNEGFPKQENGKEKSPIKEGVDFVFEQHPELIEIGTKEQYSKYLDTIFPESKIKEIVWHSTNKKFDTFDKKYIGSSTDIGSYGKGFYFSDRQRSFGDIMMPIILDIKNPISTNPVKFYEEKNNKPDFSDIEVYENYKGNYIHPTPATLTQFLLEEGFDGIAFRAEAELDPNSHVEYVVFETDQIQILGSKSDIEKFKEFVG